MYLRSCIKEDLEEDVATAQQNRTLYYSVTRHWIKPIDLLINMDISD